MHILWNTANLQHLLWAVLWTTAMQWGLASTYTYFKNALKAAFTDPHLKKWLIMSKECVFQFHLLSDFLFKLVFNWICFHWPMPFIPNVNYNYMKSNQTLALLERGPLKDNFHVFSITGFVDGPVLFNLQRLWE